MAPNLVLTMGRAVVKHKLHLGTLTGTERLLLSFMVLPDRVTTLLAACNVDPSLVDPKYDYVLLAQSVEANLELFGKVCQRVQADTIVVPSWLGLLSTGVAELGTQFKIEKTRVPYPVEYPIKTIQDVARMPIPEQATGYLKMVFDLTKEAQKRYPSALISASFQGPWDLAMLLRGDKDLPADLRRHKDYLRAKDQATRDKIRRFGDPDIYPAVMEYCSRLSIHLARLAVANGLSPLGARMMDQYAYKPMLSREDYFEFVHPYREQVWLTLNKKVGMSYCSPSPQECEQNLSVPMFSSALTNYIFPQTPEGVTLPEYDRPMLELAKAHKQSYGYLVHGKFLRDATEADLGTLMQRVCGLAVQLRAGLMVSVASVPPGASLEKVNALFNLAAKYGRY